MPTFQIKGTGANFPFDQQPVKVLPLDFPRFVKRQSHLMTNQLVTYKRVGQTYFAHE
jgi:hypothetical protein